MKKFLKYFFRIFFENFIFVESSNCKHSFFHGTQNCFSCLRQKNRGPDIMSPGLFLISMSGSSAAAAADTVVRAADGRFAGSHRDTITDRYRHANLLCHSHRTAGACSIGNTSNGRRTLAGNGGSTHHSRRGQSQRGGNIHALRATLLQPLSGQDSSA